MILHCANLQSNNAWKRAFVEELCRSEPVHADSEGESL